VGEAHLVEVLSQVDRVARQEHLAGMQAYHDRQVPERVARRVDAAHAPVAEQVERAPEAGERLGRGTLEVEQAVVEGVVELAPDEPWNWQPLVAASLSALLTTNVASGNSEIALAWSKWRWVMTTRPTLAGSIPRARSWAGAACSRSVRRSLKAKSVSRPKFSFGLTATDGWSPVSTRIGPTPGCSTRKAGTGTWSHWRRGTP
jgi:hypothetical protein